jgi:IS1 family transposase
LVYTGSRESTVAKCSNPDHEFPGHFCVNESCPVFRIRGEGNIKLKGHCGKDGGIHELICSRCGKAFSENHGTPFYQSNLSVDQTLNIVRHLVEGNGVRGTARLLGHHKDTVLRCLRKTASHVIAVLNALLQGLHCKEIQMDEFWSFVNKKEKNTTAREKLDEGYGDRWVHLAIDAVTRLIVAWNVDRRTQAATNELIDDTVRRLENPLDVLYTSDQHEPYRTGIERMISQVEQPAQVEQAVRAEQPAQVEQPEGGADNNADEGPKRPGVVYATVKKTYRQNKVVKVERVLEIGSQHDLQQRLDESPVSTKINTSFIERLNNTFRQDGRRVARKSMGFSKEPEAIEEQVILQVGFYNLVRPHGGLTLVQEREDGSNLRSLRTPAMAAGVVDKLWSLLDLLTYKVGRSSPVQFREPA